MSISRVPGQSRFEQVASAIRAEIRAGTLPPGSELPSEKYLAESFGVGRDTIRDALGLLRSEGLIDCRRGYRSRVYEPVDKMSLTLQSGEEISVRAPVAEEVDRLGLRPGEPVIELRRGSHVELYAAGRTCVRATSPEDWTTLPNA
jgi:GntR family transcriptional regulator